MTNLPEFPVLSEASEKGGKLDKKMGLEHVRDIEIHMGNWGVSALAVFAPSDGPLSAPDTYQWAALGIGRTMAGAYMYIMYSDGNGNVTISARAGGQGHVEPKVTLFPLGAMLMNMFGKWWIHAAFQTFSLAMLIAGFGLGVKLAMFKDYLFKNQGKTHTSSGLALFVLLIIQAIVGLIHHLAYRKQHVRGFLGYIHIWYGHSLLILGIIYGGLGLQLARNTKGGEIIYGLVAALVAMSYFTILVLKNMGKFVDNKAIKSGSGEEGRNIGERIPMKGRIPATIKHSSERFPATSRL
ncbi:hypothetical protein BCON_0129g00020 [Botryotinia convoluta]|uniref:Cytochrome b561 domain-containing protein n=1 Tax=Botryotinia convoluta TaxID=54673 RepID=A0A4Z1I849_9HELO|nr:hypothetical protein BCON_0129g00020 [Botryotinia convoluta]